MHKVRLVASDTNQSKAKNSKRKETTSGRTAAADADAAADDSEPGGLL